MDLDELQTVKSRERQTDSLQQLRDSFYTEASEYIQQLRDARDRAAERADDPWNDPEVGRLSDEIETAEQTVEAIHKRRVAKIVKNASLAAHGSPIDDGGLTAEEQEMFEQLVADIEENREHVLEKIAGDLPADARSGSDQPAPTAESPDQTSAGSDASGQRQRGGPAERSPPGVSAESEGPAREPPQPVEEEARTGTDGSPAGDETVPAADVMNDGGSTRAEQPTQAQPADIDRNAEAVDRRTIRITADVGAILGVDQREYDLSADDVVTLPEANAEPLLEQDAAQPLD